MIFTRRKFVVHGRFCTYARWRIVERENQADSGFPFLTNDHFGKASMLVPAHLPCATPSIRIGGTKPASLIAGPPLPVSRHSEPRSLH